MIQRLLFALLCLGTSACSLRLSPPPPVPPEEEIHDPIEDVNRSTFEFNDFLDRNVLEPVARGYNNVTPNFVQGGVRNFFDTMSYPSYLVSDIVQLKGTQAAEHTGRFLLNFTVGLLGIIDVAEGLGLPKHEEDFGVALAYHDVPTGPYVVLPLLGPSNVRDAFGTLVDAFLNPLNYLFVADIDSGTGTAIGLAANALNVVQTRADLIEAIETGKNGSADYYLFAQAAYYQFRQGLLHDGKVATGGVVGEDEEFGLGDAESGLGNASGEEAPKIKQKKR